MDPDNCCCCPFYENDCTVVCFCCSHCVYRSIKKLFHYAIFQMFFHIYIIHYRSIFYHTNNLSLMAFYFYKSSDNICL